MGLKLILRYDVAVELSSRSRSRPSMEATLFKDILVFEGNVTSESRFDGYWRMLLQIQ